MEECLIESGIKEGLVLCNAMHITASVFINDDEPGLHDDYEKWLENWRRRNRTLNIITIQMKTMPMHILREPLWAGK